jgi:hypothetical protein
LALLDTSVILRGTRASQPAAAASKIGALYGVTDEGNKLERNSGSAWEAYSPVGDVVGPSSAVADRIATFNGTTGKLIKDGGKTIATVLSDAAAAAAALDAALLPIDLASEVTGDLPLANLAQASAASKLLGRGSAAGAGDWQEITLGTNLALSGTTLNATDTGITQLTGDVTAGPGSGSQAATLAAGAVTPAKLSTQAKTRTLVVIIDGAGSAIAANTKLYVPCPYTGTITGARLLSIDAAVTSGSIVIDVWKDTYANYPPTVADTITASAKPTLSSATKSDDTTLTGWSTSVTAGDVFGFNVDSCTAITKALLQLTIVLS